MPHKESHVVIKNQKGNRDYRTNEFPHSLERNLFLSFRKQGDYLPTINIPSLVNKDVLEISKRIQLFLICLGELDPNINPVSKIIRTHNNILYYVFMGSYHQQSCTFFHDCDFILFILYFEMRINLFQDGKLKKSK